MTIVATAILAYLHYGAWALVLGTLAGSLANVAVLAPATSRWPRARFSKNEFGKLVRFGAAFSIERLLWGLMPLYWHLLKVVPSLQIVMHRMVWSALLVAGWLAWKQGRGWLRATLARPRAAWMLGLSGLLIATNWTLYVWAVNAGHVVETSLGYFINPLISVVMGVVFLHERLNRLQWISVALAATGVAWLTWQYGQPPWIALGLALTFGLYGLIRKLVAVDAVNGLGVESVYLFLPALAVLAWGETHGQGGFLPVGGAPGWGVGVCVTT